MKTSQKIKFLSPPSDCHMADEWYEFVNRDHFWIKWRFESLRRSIPKDYVWGQTLEIGCGRGVVREQIENYYGCTIVGCDLNLKALEMAVECSSPLYLYNIHNRNEDLRHKFSTILLLDVLEHVEDPVEFLNSVDFHLKPGGTLIINVPALQSLYSKYDEVIGHLRRYNIPYLKKELNSAGFYIESANYWGMSMVPLLMIRKFLLRFYRRDQIIKIGFQPSSPLIEWFLQFLMRIEQKLFPRPLGGTSIIAIVRNEKT